MIKKLLNSFFTLTNFVLFTTLLANQALAQCTTTPIDQNFTNHNYPDYNIQTVEFDCIRYSVDGDSYLAVTTKELAYYPTPVFSGKILLFSATGGANLPTKCQFETTNSAVNFKLNSFNVEFYDHSNGNSSQFYNIVGYDNGSEVVRLDGFNTKTDGAQGNANNRVTFTKETTFITGGSTSGLLAFGTGWQNIDKVVFEVADPDLRYNYLNVAIDNIDFSPAVTGTLPITLQSFDAAVKGNGVDLKWKSGTEVNNKEYLISHSTNGVDYKVLSKIPSNNEMSYSYTHLFPAAGRNYYKLQQQDFNGELNDVKVEVVNYTLSDSDEITFFPNPTTDQLTIRFEKKEFKSVDVVNVNGNVVYTQSIPESEYESRINVSSLPKGIYFLQMKDYSNKTTSRKFIKK